MRQGAVEDFYLVNLTGKAMLARQRGRGETHGVGEILAPVRSARRLEVAIQVEPVAIAIVTQGDMRVEVERDAACLAFKPKSTPLPVFDVVVAEVELAKFRRPVRVRDQVLIAEHARRPEPKIDGVVRARSDGGVGDVASAIKAEGLCHAAANET